MIDQDLKSFATQRELEIISAIEKNGSHQRAADALNITRQTVGDAIKRLKLRAAQKGYSPEHDMTRTVPDGYTVRGVSTYYNKDGKPSGQWVKSAADNERRKQMMDAAAIALSETIKRVKPITKKGKTLDKLCNLYTITDAHVGMLAWHKEGGDDWDLTIAEKTLTACFEQMVASSPAAAVCLINQLGDFLHYDGLLPITPQHGHILDADGRFSKMVAVAIRILRRVIDFALMRHEIVIVLLAEGNHDIASSVWLRHMFKALYENEPRVKVIDSELPYYAHQHGKTMLSFHHGHMKKNDSLPLLFATSFSEMWGSTTYRYAHTGHRHHIEEKEHSGMSVIQHSTLAAKDAYAARGGWASSRQARVMTYHSEYGLVAVNVVTPEMLED